MIAAMNPGGDIIERMKGVFGWIEQWDMRVGELWLHPKQVEELNAANDPGWDRVAQRAVVEAYREEKGALLIGYLWGAYVFQSEIVVPDHVVALPTGLQVKLLDSTACRPF